LESEKNLVAFPGEYVGKIEKEYYCLKGIWIIIKLEKR